MSSDEVRRVTFPSTGNEIALVLRPSGVTIEHPTGDLPEISWGDWEFVAKVHGKRSP
jgi:hypothetical protein